MEKPLSKQEVIDMIVAYYRESERKEVSADISTGKIVSADKWPIPNVLNIDVREIYAGPKGDASFPLPVGIDDVERIVAAMLLKEGFEVSKVKFNTVATDGGVVFTGLTVTGEEKDLNNGISM